MKRTILTCLRLFLVFCLLLCCSFIANIANARIFIRSPLFLPTCTPATGLIISEFRLRGPGGVNDEFIELYNNTNAALTVCTADGSSGWAVVSADGTVRFVIPSETTIPARGHLLATSSGYSLSSYAVGDLTYTSNIPDNNGIALFNTANPTNFSTATRLDAVGFSSNASLYREGTGLASIGLGFVEYCFRRNLANGTPADTNDNIADFQYLATDGTFGSKLGAPGPENLSSPIQRNANISMLLLDTTVAASLAPNRVHDPTSDPANNSTLGTLSVRRRIVNNTGVAVSRLRFRVTSITTYPPPSGTADLRARTSTTLVNVTVNDSNTCASTGTPSTPPCTVTVQGLTLEQPPNQPNGGGFNSTLSVALPQPLAAGASVNVQTLLGVQQGGSFHFFLNVEAMTDTAGVRLDPMNQTGGAGEDPLSRNFNWNVPLLSLPGRAGLDLGLSLAYNSLVWTKSGSYISFDDDRGFPSPGFRLGFPVIQPLYYNAQAGKNAYLLITPNGDRVELRQVGTSGPLFESVDSSYLLLNTSTMTLRTTDGTQLSFDWMGSDFQCTEIKDRNGNFITINYNEFGRINTIVDTLNRTIRFNYTGNSLSSITQTWTVNGAPVTHTWASFAYRNPDLTIQTNFQGLTNVGPQNGSTLKVLSQVTVNDGSSFTFDYTSWGQVRKISHLGTDGHLRNYRSYNLPSDQTTAQTDCPRFTQRLDWARNWNGDTNGVPATIEETITGFVAPSATSWTMSDGTAESGTLAQVTFPDGTTQKIYSHATGWDKGLPLLTETHGRSTPGATLIKQKSVVTKWNQDNLALPLNPRVEETNIYDFDDSGEILNRARTSLTYQTVNLPDGTTCKLPKDLKEYQANASTVLRRTHTDYNLSTTYTSRRVIGLVSEKTFFEGDTQAETLMSKVAFRYDETGSIQGNDAPVQHDNTNYTSSFVTGRANLSSVKRYDVTNTSLFITSSIKYNTAGSVVQTTDPANHSITLSYSDAFAQNGTTLDPTLSFTTLAYPTMVTDADGFRSSTRYNYDFGSPTWKRTPLPNSLDNLPGPTEVCPSNVVCPEQKFAYDDKGRIQRTTNLVNSAYTKFIYGPNYVQSFATVNTVADETRNVQVFDGAGRVIAKVNNHPNSTGGFAAQRLIYDNMGRVHKQSNPTETSISITGIPLQPSDWQATGDDEFNSQTGQGGWLFTQQTYDWNGRPLVATNTDGTTKEASYSGCGCAGGEVMTLAGEIVMLPPQGGSGVWSPDRRKRKIYADVLGRVVKSEILNRDGTPYVTTITQYNARDQVTSIKEYKGVATLDGACPTGTCQVTTTQYDGHGRLRTRHLPEQGVGTVTTWDYNSDDTIQKITDARGASETFNYNARHLVMSITYAWPGGGTVPTPASFAYDATGNRISMTDSTGSFIYHYDQLSRIDWEERTFAGLAGITYRFTYGYNLAGDLTSLIEPSQFGSSVSYSYDVARRLNTVIGSGFSGGTFEFATNPKYRAWGSLKEMSYGNGLKLNNSFNSRLQITSYQVKVPGTPVGQGEHARSDYEYEADGRISQAYDRTDAGFDRSYLYDHVGRLIDAKTFSAAYFQSFSYDEFDNLILRSNGSWRYHDTTQMQYLYNRNTSTTVFPNGGQPQTSVWVYDAEGNLTKDHNKQYTFDAAGEKRLVFENTSTRSLWIHQEYDADGERAKRIEQSLPFGNPLTTVTSYYLRSSVLDSVVIELDQNGQKHESYVHANGAIIAQQRNNQVQWVHADPVTGSLRETTTNGDPGWRREFDPLGNDTPLIDPAPPEEPTPDYLYTGTYGNNGNTYDGASGCTIDGQPIDCSFTARLVSTGLAAPCPDNRCGPRHNGNGWEFLRFTDSGLIYESETSRIVYGGVDARTGAGWQKVRTRKEQRKVDRPPLPRPARRPQNTERPFTPDELRIFGSDIRKLLQGRKDCLEFISSLLLTVATQTQRALYSTNFISDPIQIFEAIARSSKGGYFLAPGQGDAGRAGGGISTGNAKVTLDVSFSGFSFVRGLVGLHENIHEASGVGLDKYTDRELAFAAYQVAWAQGFRNLPSPPKSEVVALNSKYWNEFLFAACSPNQKSK